MRLLICVALVASAIAFPRKPTKDIPKKFDSSLHGLKDTYLAYDEVPVMELEVPAEYSLFDAFVPPPPPSSYNSYIEQQAEDPILPPKGSTYTGLVGDFEEEPLFPPSVDSYSIYSGSRIVDFAAPPVYSESQSDDGSYASYQGKEEVPMIAPELSSYVGTSQEDSGADILASMAAMIQSLPKTDTYDGYDLGITNLDAANAPSLILTPPKVEQTSEDQHSSYDEVPQQQPELTPEQISALEEAGTSIPATSLLPPSP